MVQVPTASVWVSSKLDVLIYRASKQHSRLLSVDITVMFLPQ